MNGAVVVCVHVNGDVSEHADVRCKMYHGSNNYYQQEFFFSTRILAKNNRDLAKKPEFRKVTIMISWSEIILFFFVAR